MSGGFVHNPHPIGAPAANAELLDYEAKDKQPTGNRKLNLAPLDPDEALKLALQTGLNPKSDEAPPKERRNRKPKQADTKKGREQYP